MFGSRPLPAGATRWRPPRRTALPGVPRSAARNGRQVPCETTAPGMPRAEGGGKDYESRRAARPPLCRSCGLARACHRRFRGRGGGAGGGLALAEVTSGPAVCGGAGRAGPSAERAERSGAGGVRAGHGGAAAPLRTAGERRGGDPGHAPPASPRGGSRAPPPPLRRCRAAASTPRGGAAPRYCLRRHPGPAGAAGAEQSGGGGRRPRAVTARAGPRAASGAARFGLTHTRVTDNARRRLRCYRNVAPEQVRLPGEGPRPWRALLPQPPP